MQGEGREVSDSSSTNGTGAHAGRLDADHVRCCQYIHTEMGDHTRSVSFCNGETVTPSIPFPSDIFEALLLGPQIEKLKVTGFNVVSVDTVLHRLKETSPSKLKVLHLPFHTAASGISLSRLRFIALHCTQLVSFRCRFKHLSNTPAYDTPDPLSHQLQVQSVANAEPHQDHQGLLQISRYLD